jgi:uncharacterized cysteine cluster protein YcgN (CxxCxxCC family)
MKWWEKLCCKCGVCCYKKKIVDGLWKIDFNDPCEYMELQSKTCMIYEKRFEMCRDCKKMTIIKALFADFLPDNCGYVQFFERLGFFKIIKRRKI